MLRLIMLAGRVSAQQVEVQQQLQRDESVNSSAQIVHHDSRSFRQPFEAADGWRLHDIERPEKYKAHEQRFPKYGARNERYQLAGDFVDDDVLWVLLAAAASFERGCGNANS